MNNQHGSVSGLSRLFLFFSTFFFSSFLQAPSCVWDKLRRTVLMFGFLALNCTRDGI